MFENVCMTILFTQLFLIILKVFCIQLQLHRPINFIMLYTLFDIHVVNQLYIIDCENCNILVTYVCLLYYIYVFLFKHSVNIMVSLLVFFVLHAHTFKGAILYALLKIYRKYYIYLVHIILCIYLNCRVFNLLNTHVINISYTFIVKSGHGEPQVTYIKHYMPSFSKIMQIRTYLGSNRQ